MTALTKRGRPARLARVPSHPLNALHAFVAVARRQSFVAAARDLGLTSSALSQSVRQLEERVGAPLLTRTSRSVALTDAGRRVLEQAGPALDQALGSLRLTPVDAKEVTGRLRLTVPAVAIQAVLTRLVPRFCQRHPQVELEVNVDNRLVDIVRDGFDAGIRLMESIDRDMVSVRLFGACRLVVAGAPSYLDLRGTPEKPEDLLQHDCIGVRFGANETVWAWELDGRNKKTIRLPVRGPLITSDGQLSDAAAVAGVGLVYRLEPLIADHLAAGRLRVVLAPYAPKVPGLFLYFPDRARVSPALKAFVAVSKEFSRESRTS
jgi:DNA-binding transcriptional LysR family regulator